MAQQLQVLICNSCYCIIERTFSDWYLTGFCTDLSKLIRFFPRAVKSWGYWQMSPNQCSRSPHGTHFHGGHFCPLFTNQRKKFALSWREQDGSAYTEGHEQSWCAFPKVCIPGTFWIFWEHWDIVNRQCLVWQTGELSHYCEVGNTQNTLEAQNLVIKLIGYYNDEFYVQLQCYESRLQCIP